MEKINLKEKLSLFNSYWDPKIIGELNGQHVKLVKFQGDFVWHKHDNEDELFLVIDGSFDMHFRDKVITIHEGEFIIVPREIEHCPKSEKEVQVLLFEPIGTLNTGNAQSDKSVTDPEYL